MRKSLLSFALVLCLVAFVSVSSFGQITAPVADQAPPVFDADHNFLQTHSLNESVNPATGAVSVKITIDVPADRGMGAQFDVEYDSNSAHHGQLWMGNAAYLAAGGWSYVFPSVAVTSGMGVNSNQHCAITPGCSGGYGGVCPYYTNYMMTDLKGTTHTLPLTALTMPGCTYPYGMYQNLSGGDSRVVGVTEPFPAPPGKPTPLLLASDNDGTVYTFNSAAHQFPGDNQFPTTEWMSVSSIYTAVATSIEDRNGNVVNVADQNNGKISIQDTLGRTAVSTDGFGVGTTHITVPGLNAYTVVWQQQPFAETWNVKGIVDPGVQSLSPEPYCSFGTTVNGSSHATSSGTFTSTVTASQNADQPVISELDLPNGQKYLFQYDWNGATGTGLLSQITYPDGAVVNYYWTINPRSVQEVFGSTNPQFACEAESDVPALQKKTVKFDGINIALEQDYSYSTNWAQTSAAPFEAWTTKSTTVTTKVYAIVNGSQQLNSQYETVYNYIPLVVPSVPNPYAITGVSAVNPAESSILYYADMGQTPIKQVNKSYWDYWQLPSDVKETVDNGQTRETQTCYLGVASYPAGSLCSTSNGNSGGIGSLVSDVFSLDYGTATGSAANPGSPGALLQHKHADYNSFSAPLFPSMATILDREKDIITYDGSGNEVAESDYCYDNATGPFSECKASTAIAPVSATQHDETNYGSGSTASRGNVTTAISRCFVGASGTPCTQGDSTTQYAWYETGQMASKTDANGNVTQYFYVDSFATDDANEGAAPAATNAYLTSISDALGHTSSFKYAFNDGALRRITGPNGEVTNYYYYDTKSMVDDPLRRFKESDAADGGQTQVSYNDTPYPPTIVTKKAYSAGNYVTSTATTDGMGHVYKTVLTDKSPSNDETDTIYDGWARAYQVTNPYRSPSDTTYGVSTTQYDALGRVISLTRQDGGVVTTAYSGPMTTVTDELGNQRSTVTDALGRLIQVNEPGDPQAATPAAGTLDVNGNSLKSNTTAAKQAQATITIQANNPCRQFQVGGQGPQTICDQGTVWAKINNGNQISATYVTSSNTNLNTIAQNLASAISQDSTAKTIVSASANGNVVTIQALSAGTGGNNIALSSGATSSYNTGAVIFNPAGISAGASNTTLVNGTNSSTTYDYGNLTVSVGSWTSANVPYGQSGSNGGNNTNSLVMSALTSALNASGSPVTAQILNGGIQLTETTPGSAANGTQVSVNSSSSNSALYGSGSFSGTGIMLGGGSNGGSTLVVPYVTLYSYDTLGNLLCVEQHGDSTTGTGCSAAPGNDATSSWRVRRFTYNSLSELLTAYNPETGTISYTYDPNGNVITKTDARSVAITYSYDALNRIKGETFSTGDPAIALTYDQGAKSANPIGHRTGMTDASGSTTWAYDALGRVTSEQRTINPGGSLSPVTKTVSYGYDLLGRVTQITYPDNTVINYGMDSSGLDHDASVTDSTNSINYVTGATYAPTGSLASFKEQAGSISTITNSFVYNPRLQICREMASTTGVVPTLCTDTHTGEVMDFQYDFHIGNHDNGNLYQAINNKDATRTQAFTYDALNRLLTAKTSGINCSVMVSGSTTQTKYWGESFTYDPWANLTGKGTSQCSAENTTLAVNVQNKLVADSYDAAGNVINSGGAAYTYNGESELVSAGGYSYVYDGDGNRIEKTNGSTGTLYWYGAPGILLETDLTGAPQSEYVFFGGQRVARRDLSGMASPVYYYLANQIHSTALITDNNGNVEDDADYYPWGGTLQFSTGVSNHYLFSGKERDAETGLDYFGARYYGNTMGRFLTPDWSAKVEGIPYADYNDPQSLNLYGYVRDNPITRIDADGHCLEDACVIETGAALAWASSPQGQQVIGNAIGGLVVLGGTALAAWNNVGEKIDNKLKDWANSTSSGTGTVGSAGISTASFGVVDDRFLGINRSSNSSTTAQGNASQNGQQSTPADPNKDKDKKQTGSYTNTHASGKTYDGKGDKQRSQASGQRVEKEHNDKHTSTDWKPAANDREAFKDESRRLDSHGGHQSSNNYNQRDSPGANYRKQDGTP